MSTRENLARICHKDPLSPLDAQSDSLQPLSVALGYHSREGLSTLLIPVRARPSSVAQRSSGMGSAST